MSGKVFANIRRLSRTRLLDGLIVVAALSAAWSLIDRPALRAFWSTTSQQPWISVGAILTLPGIDWTLSSTNVILAFTTSCQYCQESGEFYARLAESITTRRQDRFIVVCPEPRTSIEKWMRDRGVKTFEQVIDNFHLRGFAVTPTIAFVDSTGIVTDLVVGKLTTDEEAQVFQRLEGKLAPPLMIRAELATRKAQTSNR